MPAAVAVPAGLGDGGAALWSAVTVVHSLDAVQLVQLLEACRAKDRLDRLDELLRGDVDVWARLTHRANTDDYELKIDDALGKANSTANLLKQLLAAMRLADEVSGKRPQHRGGSRGAYASGGANPSGTVSSLERARQRANGA